VSDTLLDIESSFMQARWVAQSVDQDNIDNIVRQHGLPEIVARLLSARNVKPENVEEFLYPTLKDHFPDPLLLKGMKELVNDLAEAVISGSKIGVFGDFDVDGATSTAILVRFFRHLKRDVPFYIPDRLIEGYGPNVTALKVLKDEGVETVIICDCGTTSFDVIAEGRELGLNLIILDHHEAEDNLPDANHIINPKRKDDNSGLDMLAACGVVFMTCVAVNARLREHGWYREQCIKEPRLKDLLDIVALGTVCDMVPLTGVNRILLRSGFAHMARLENPGIKALCEVGKVDNAPTTFTAGFVLGPRINAGSRVHDAALGAKILTTDDFEEAKNIAWILNDCNDKRKEIENDMYDQAVSMVEESQLDKKPLIFVANENWHPGLSGLVAGRLKERYGKPACLVTFAELENGVIEGRGSGRSVTGINMGAAFIDARNEGLLLKGGGHAMAAGFTVLPDKMDALQEYLSSHITDQLDGRSIAVESVIDGVLSVMGATKEFVHLVHNNIGPFGTDNPEPLFVLPNVRLHMVDIVGKDHVRCMISDWEGGKRIKAIAFRSKDTPLGEAMLKYGQSQPLHVVGHLNIDSWNGRENVQMFIKDAAFVMENNERKIA
jgi:single-stranded-DNA-specific exonuclease